MANSEKSCRLVTSSLVPRPPPFFGLRSVLHTEHAEALFHFRVLYWTQTEERGRPGNELGNFFSLAKHIQLHFSMVLILIEMVWFNKPPEASKR